MHQGTFSHLRRVLTISALYAAVCIPVNQEIPPHICCTTGFLFIYIMLFAMFKNTSDIFTARCTSCIARHSLMAQSSSLRLDIHQITEYFQCSVCLMGQYAFCQYFTELYTFLGEAVYVPYESLEHDFVFEV